MATQEESQVRKLEALFIDRQDFRRIYLETDNGLISLEELIRQKHEEHREIQVPATVTFQIALKAASEEKGTSLSAGPTKLCCYRYGPDYPEICFVVPVHEECPR